MTVELTEHKNKVSEAKKNFYNQIGELCIIWTVSNFGYKCSFSDHIDDFCSYWCRGGKNKLDFF